jgi:hypothetical protein
MSSLTSGSFTPSSIASGSANTTIDIQNEAGCANNIGYTRITKIVHDNTTSIDTVEVSYRNSANVETALAPVGFTLGACAQKDTNVGVNSFAINIDNAANGGAGLLGLVLGAYNAITVYNRSATALLRVTLSFGGGQTATGGDTSFLVPMGGTYSDTFDGDVIVGYAVQYVSTPSLVSGIVDGDSLAAATLAGMHQSILTFSNA